MTRERPDPYPRLSGGKIVWKLMTAEGPASFRVAARDPAQRVCVNPETGVEYWFDPTPLRFEDVPLPDIEKASATLDAMLPERVRVEAYALRPLVPASETVPPRGRMDPNGLTGYWIDAFDERGFLHRLATLENIVEWAAWTYARPRLIVTTGPVSHIPFDPSVPFVPYADSPITWLRVHRVAKREERGDESIIWTLLDPIERSFTIMPSMSLSIDWYATLGDPDRVLLTRLLGEYARDLTAEQQPAFIRFLEEHGVSPTAVRLEAIRG